MDTSRVLRGKIVTRPAAQQLPLFHLSARGNLGVESRNSKYGRAGMRLFCYACGRQFFDNLDLPVTIDLRCPHCGKSHFGEVR